MRAAGVGARVGIARVCCWVPDAELGADPLAQLVGIVHLVLAHACAIHEVGDPQFHRVAVRRWVRIEEVDDQVLNIALHRIVEEQEHMLVGFVDAEHSGYAGLVEPALEIRQVVFEDVMRGHGPTLLNAAIDVGYG